VFLRGNARLLRNRSDTSGTFRIYVSISVGIGMMGLSL